MGASTVLKAKGHVPASEVLKFIRERFDGGHKEATSNVKTTKGEPISDIAQRWSVKSFTGEPDKLTESGFIFFTFNGEKRMLFYSYTNVGFLKDMANEVEQGVPEEIVGEHTYFSLGAGDDAVEILSRIGAVLQGAYLQRNDCNDPEWRAVTWEGTLEPVKHITMAEVYEAFGETVVIDL